MIGAEHRQAGVTVVEIEAPRLDAAGAESFRESMRRIIERGERHIALDFGRVEFMDSTGLGALVGCLKSMGEGGAIDILNPRGRVMKVLKLTRMDQVFTIHSAAG